MPKKNTDKTAEQSAQQDEEIASVSDNMDNMGDTEQEATAAPKEPEYEIVNIPPAGPGEEEVLVLYVNGRSYVMDKGAAYRLPKAVAAEYHRSVRAAHRATKRKSELRKKEQAINAYTDAVIAGKA